MCDRETRPDITVVSTLTVDRLPADENGQRREQPGGPAHYICAALERMGRSYVLVTGARAMVDVIQEMGEEYYVIPPLPTVELPACFETPAVILSPIMREIDPSFVPAIPGLLAIDLQGFVRTPSQRTDVLSTVNLADLIAAAHVVKASENELGQLDEESRAALRDRILVQTLGVRGAVIQMHGEQHHVRAHPVEARNTIGAGDSYLASFVTGMLDTGDPVRAGEQAARFTERVLLERQAGQA